MMPFAVQVAQFQFVTLAQFKLVTYIGKDGFPRSSHAVVLTANYSRLGAILTPVRVDGT